MLEKQSALTTELRELYDIRSRKVRDEKVLFQLAQEVKIDIKNLTLMFSDGITDVSVEVNQNEFLEWNSKSKRLIYHLGEESQFIEGVRADVLIRLKPYLKDLVRKAKEFYL